MNHITGDVLREAADQLDKLNAVSERRGSWTVHTVTIILNGQHGGADVAVEGVITTAGGDRSHRITKVIR